MANDKAEQAEKYWDYVAQADLAPFKTVLVQYSANNEVEVRSSHIRITDLTSLNECLPINTYY